MQLQLNETKENHDPLTCIASPQVTTVSDFGWKFLKFMFK